jgi:N utilization substance protein B
VSARSKARKRALDVLFEADQRGVDPLDVLAAWAARADPAVTPYAASLVEGVVAEGERLDGLLAGAAVDWSLERMPPVDRTVLRIGAYELICRDDVPDPVAIDEAVTLAKDLSTDESPSFVNGVLARLLAEKGQPPSDRSARLAAAVDHVHAEDAELLDRLGNE